MIKSRTIVRVEADLHALKAAADRAGLALACLFSTADEFESAVLRARREKATGRMAARIREACGTLALAACFLLI